MILDQKSKSMGGIDCNSCSPDKCYVPYPQNVEIVKSSISCTLVLKTLLSPLRQVFCSNFKCTQLGLCLHIHPLMVFSWEAGHQYSKSVRLFGSPASSYSRFQSRGILLLKGIKVTNLYSWGIRLQAVLGYQTWLTKPVMADLMLQIS